MSGGRGLRLEASGLALRSLDGDLLVDIDRLALPAGAQVALTGPSGAGKTTLLHLLAGIARPAAGAIRWGGEDLVALGGKARDRWRGARVGLVFQDFHLIPELDILGNVLLPARFNRFRLTPQVRDAARALAARVGLTHSGRRAALLSRGERQRTAVARALLHGPAVILADEPTASLDEENAGLVADLLLDASMTSGATLILATHDPALIERLPVRWSMSGGRVEVLGVS